MISAKNISFSYGEREVLTDVSVPMEHGQRWAVIGKNGAGKSTFVKCLAGLEKPSAGSVSIDSKKIGSISVAQMAKLIAYVPQVRDRAVPFSVFDYVMMGRYPYQGMFAIASIQDKEIVENALALTDCIHLRDRPMSELSGGEQQRVLLAGAVSQQTKVLLLDEPTTFLDPLHQVQLERALDRVHKEADVTVVTVTHDLNQALHYYDHILALVDGKAFYAGPTKAFLAECPAILECVFGLEFRMGRLESGEVFVMPKT